MFIFAFIVIMFVIAIVLICIYSNTDNNAYDYDDDYKDDESLIADLYNDENTTVISTRLVNKDTHEYGTAKIYEVKTEKHYSDITPIDYKKVYTYEVKGINSSTGRQKKYMFYTFNEEYAKRKAAEKGLIEPYTITLCDHPATERQKAFVRDLGLTVFADMQSEEASCIISRTYEGEPPPEEWLVNFAISHDIPFCLYATNGDILMHIRKEFFTDIIHELMFWVFCVNRFAFNDNLFYEIKFHTIAQELHDDSNFMKYYLKSKNEYNIDYINMRTRTNVYKMTKEKLQCI